MKKIILILTMAILSTFSACSNDVDLSLSREDQQDVLQEVATENEESVALKPIIGDEESSNRTKEAYMEILTAYVAAVSERWNASTLMENGLNYLIADCYGDEPGENIGYVITDLDGDGIQELVIGATENITDEFYGKMIFAIYSLKADNSIVQVFSSMERDRYYYVGDSLFAHLGSSGASDSFDTVVKYEDYSLIDTQGEIIDYIQMDLLPMSQWMQQMDMDLSNAEPVELELPILDVINENVEIDTAGSFTETVQTTVELLDWGVGTGLDVDEIKEATVAWLRAKGNDEQVTFAKKLAQVDEVYLKLLGEGAEELLASAGYENFAYPWSDVPVEPVEAIMEAVGLR